MRNTAIPPASTILFDAGNTLAFLDLARVAAALAAAGHPVDEAALETAEARARALMYRRAGAEPSLTDRGRWVVYVHEMLDAVAFPAERRDEGRRALEDAHRETNLWRRVPEGTAEVLARLARRGFRLGVVSNADGRVRRLLEELRLAHHFGIIVDSHEVGVEKPDPRIFEVARAHFGEPAERCVYVGDFPGVDVVGARRAGMTPVLLDPIGHGLGEAHGCAAIASLGELPGLLSLPPERDASGAARRAA